MEPLDRKNHYFYGILLYYFVFDVLSHFQNEKNRLFKVLIISSNYLINPKKINQMEHSIKVYSKTNKNDIFFIIDLKLIKLDLKDSFKIHIFTTNNQILKNCVFHEIDIITDQNIETEMQAVTLVMPFIHERLLCSDKFCLFLTYHKLNIHNSDLRKIYLGERNPVKKIFNGKCTNKCYQDVSNKDSIIRLHKARTMADIIEYLNMVDIEYKINYICNNLELTEGLLNSVNINIMTYNHRIYFLMKIIEYYNKIRFNRKAAYYQVRLWILLNINMDIDLKIFVYRNLNIIGKNWIKKFLGTEEKELKIEIVGDSDIRKIDKLFIPRIYKDATNERYCLDNIILKCNMEIYIKYIETKDDCIDVFHKSKYFIIPIMKSSKLKNILYSIDGEDYVIKIIYDICKIDSNIYMRRIRDQKIENAIKFMTNVLEIRMVTENIVYSINNKILSIKRKEESNEKIIFLYILSENYECAVTLDEL